MKNQQLTYSLKLEAQDDGYLAYFPALRGCHTWGREAVKHAEEALTLYLEALVENGQPIPEEHASTPVSLGIRVRLDDETRGGTREGARKRRAGSSQATNWPRCLSGMV